MRRAEVGLTLIEMLVAVGTLGLVAVVAASLFAQGMHTYSAGQAAGLVIADVRFAVEHIATRLREARPGSVAVADAGRQITFQVWDITRNYWRPLTYRLAGTDIQLDGQPMAAYVQNLQFELAPGGRDVTITAITVSAVPGARPGTGLPFTFRTRAVLRN